MICIQLLGLLLILFRYKYKMLKDEEKVQEGCDDETLNQHTRAIIIGCLLR